MKTRKLRLNIAIVLPSIISKSGTAKQSVELAKILVKKGHKVAFFTFAYLKKSSFPEFEEFEIYSCINIGKSFFYRFIKKISLLEKIYLYYSLFFMFRFRNLFHNKIIDILNPHDWFGLWVIGGLETDAAIVVNINDVPDRTAGNLIDKLKLKIDRKNTKKIDHLIVLDNNNKKRATEWLGISKNKVSVIRSGIDIDKYKNFGGIFDIRRHLCINKNSLLLVCANLLAPNRRYEDVLDTISRLNNIITKPIHLIILSKLDFDIKYAKFLKKIIEENNLMSQVHFIDKFFSDEERMMYIKNSDILVFPNTPQTWGLTVIEAMALGVPVIVSSGAGVSEVLHDNVDAIIYKERDVQELTEKLSTCIKNEVRLRQIAKNGERYAFSSFSWEKFAEKIERVMIENAKKQNA